MEKKNTKSISSRVPNKTKKNGANKPRSLCLGCPYGKHHEFCFPCMKHILGQGGYH